MSEYAVMPLEDYANICDTVREKTATIGSIKSGELAEKISTVFKKGAQSEYDRFWDIYQDYGERYNWLNAFVRWDKAIYNPKYPFYKVKYGSNMYANTSTITDTLQPITFTEDFATVSAVFQNCSSLKTIRNIHVFENMTYGNWFSGCKALENITFTGVIGNDINFNASPLLTHDSLMNIINHLKDYSGTSETRTLTIGSTNLAKLTDNEKAIATQKGWTLA